MRWHCTGAVPAARSLPWFHPLGPCPPHPAGAHAGFALAEQQAAICIQALQLRGRPEMRWLTPDIVRRLEARGRGAVARAADCVQQLKPWLQPHKLTREKSRLRSMEQALAAATRGTPTRGERKAQRHRMAWLAGPAHSSQLKRCSLQAAAAARMATISC